MQKKRIAVLFFALVILLLCLLVGCGSGTVKVSFYADGALIETYYVEKGGALLTEPEVPEKEGYVGAWDVTDFDEVNQDLKVSAVYTLANYIVTFMVDGTIYQTYSVRRSGNLSVVPAVPEKNGYVGTWNVTDFSNIRQDISIKAVYTPAEYTVTFRTTQDTTTETIVTVKYGETLTNIPSVPVYPYRNYSAEWRYNAGTEAEPDWVTPKFTDIRSSMVVEAHYFVTVTYVDGYLSKYQFTTEIGESVTALPEGDRPGHNFFGWYHDSAFTTPVTLPYAFTENSLLYARWMNMVSGSTGLEVNAEGLITKYQGTAVSVVIPYYAEAEGRDVVITGIAAGAFLGNDTVRTVSLPSTLNTIGEGAFQNCTALTEINFLDQNGIRVIGDYAFDGCIALKSFDLSAAKEIGAHAFGDCLELDTLNGLGVSAVEKIGDYAFVGANKLQALNLPATLKEIGAYAFYGLSGTAFTFVNVNSVERVGEYAFWDCVRLTSFRPENVKKVGTGAFGGCVGLTALSFVSDTKLFELFRYDDGNLPAGFSDNHYTVKHDGKTYYIPRALYTVTVVANTVAGGGESELAAYALKDFISVKVVTFSGVLSVIREKAFFVDENTVTARALTVTLPNGLLTIEKEAFLGRNDIESIVLPMTLKRVDAYAFYGITKLSKVSIVTNNSLTEVGEYAFHDTEWFDQYSGLVKLGSVALGLGANYLINTTRDELTEADFSGVQSIAPYAFANLSKLRKIALSSSVVTIGSYAFYNNTGLREAVLSESVTEYGTTVFSGAGNIISLGLPVGVSLYTLFGDRSYANSYEVTSSEGTYYLPVTLIELILLCGEITDITAGIYNGLSSVKNIHIGEGIERIFDGAFYGNVNLTDISLPASLTEVGTIDLGAAPSGVFGNTALARVVIAENSTLTKILEQAFFGVPLEFFHVPKSVTVIAREAFAETALTYLTFQEGAEDLTIGEKAFRAVSGFTKGFVLAFPDRLVELGEGAFLDCITLSAVNVNEKLIKLGKNVFKNCDLKEFTLTESIAVYDGEDNCLVAELLYGNSNLQTLTLYQGVRMSDLFGVSLPHNLAVADLRGGEVLSKQFFGVTTLQTIHMQNITLIGEAAFENCTALRRVLVPTSVLSIDDYAFRGCSGLSSFMFDNGSQLETVGEYVFSGAVLISEVIFPDSVNNTDWVGVFENCVLLNKTNLPASVVHIGDNAYFKNLSLAEFLVTNRIQSIGENAFFDCKNLEFGQSDFSGVVTVGEYAFFNCEKLRGFRALDLTAMGAEAFSGAAALTEVTVTGDKKISYYTDNFAGVVTVNISNQADTVPNDFFDGCSSLEMIIFYGTDKASVSGILDTLSSVGLPAGIKLFVQSGVYAEVKAEAGLLADSIYRYGLVLTDNDYRINTDGTAEIIGYSGTEEIIYLPTVIEIDSKKHTVTSIASNAFSGKAFLKEVIIPMVVEKIGSSAFKNCSGLKKVIFETGSKLNLIGREAFAYCSALQKIALPNGVERIENNAFYQATALTEVTVQQGSQLVYIGDYAFYGTTALGAFAALGRLEYLGAYAFAYAGIQSFDFGGNAVLTVIPQGAFSNCQSLREIVLPVSVVEIGAGAFTKSGLGRITLTMTAHLSGQSNIAFPKDTTEWSLTVIYL